MNSSTQETKINKPSTALRSGGAVAIPSKGYKVTTIITAVIMLVLSFAHFSGLHYALIFDSTLYYPLMTYYPGNLRLPGATHLYSSCTNLANAEYIVGAVLLISSIFMFAALLFRSNPSAAKKVDFVVRRIWFTTYLIYTVVLHFAEDSLFAVSEYWDKLYLDALKSFRSFALIFTAILGISMLISYLCADRYYGAQAASDDKEVK